LKYIILNIVFLLFVKLCSAQNYNYVQYDTKDGLAGSTVYDMCQDNDGFIWFATENGVSRFDGKHFKNYTTKDGLPDNEVLKMYADSRGRIWYSTFNKQIAYYKSGKIFNDKNNILLQKIKINAYNYTIFEDINRNVFFTNVREVFLIDTANNYKEVYALNSRQIFNNISFGCRKNYFDNNALLILDDSAFTYKNNALVFLYKCTLISNKENISVYEYADGKRLELTIPGGYINFENIKNYVSYVNTNRGTWVVDTATKKLSELLLPGKRISCTKEDKEKNIWLCTLGDGIYKLPSREFKNINSQKKDDENNAEVFTINKYKNSIFAGLGFSKVNVIQANKIIAQFNFKKQVLSASNSDKKNRLYTSLVLNNGNIILGFDSYLVKMKENTPLFKYIAPVKSIAEIDNNYIVVGTATFAFKIRTADLAITDTIWRGRCTSVFYYDNYYYIGTASGLYRVDKNKSSVFLGNIHPSLSRRINDMKISEDGILWIATNDEGLLAFKNDKVVTVLKDSNGLSSNICKTIFINKNDVLWVGSNKGIDRVDMDTYRFRIINYSTFDGLPTNVINALYIKDSIVYAGSSEGLTYFNEKKISNSSLCNLVLLNVTISGKEQLLNNEYNISYKKSNISFEYAGISFRSGDNIMYNYKLKGLDNVWKVTKENSLIYQSLPSGEYELQIYAVNKFGVQSNNIVIRFIVSTPFWKTWWFYLLVLLSVIGITITVVNKKNRLVQMKLKEENLVLQKFAELEQQALQAQMNPHFIFNCLNSIQQYILTNDKAKANRYLTGFAALIRQTLDNSSKKTITITEEVKYLTNYIEMEKMRFGDDFVYNIIIDSSLPADHVQMPAMLLQPYVENSLRHGIRSKKGNAGEINISFLMEGNILHCIVADNGIGRKAAELYKSMQHIEYQSKGMHITEKRINLLNKINTHKITVEIFDLENTNGIPCGTKIIVKIPL
jgi:sensor histidine kinase YesM/ligand-binding sensor domain-containing protein